MTYFRSEVIAKKTYKKAAYDDFGWNFSRTVPARITKFYKLMEDNRPKKFA